MGSGNYTGCSGRFYDSGSGAADYSNNELFIETFCSGTPGQCIQIDFHPLKRKRIRMQCTCMMVIQRLHHSSVFSGTLAPFTVTASTGCLTIQWESDGGTVLQSWFGIFNCVPCWRCIRS